MEQLRPTAGRRPRTPSWAARPASKFVGPSPSCPVGIAKFEKVVATGDSLWSGPAAKQIDRQLKLIKIREAKKEQEQYE